MDVVLKKIHYNPEVFSKIVEDFEDFLAVTQPGAFYTCLGQWSKRFPEAELKEVHKDLKNSPVIYLEYFPQAEEILYKKMITDKLEEGLKDLKNSPEIYLEDFSHVTAILEGDDPEENFDNWIDPLPCHLHIFYHTVMRILWNRNCQRYTTALGDTGKA